jgi:two-component system response regulator
MSTVGRAATYLMRQSFPIVPLTKRPVEILMVEDNPGDVHLLKSALEASRLVCSIQVAEDGETALALLHRQAQFAGTPRPNLILLDLNLPGIKGHEVLAQIKRDPQLRAIPVLILTSSAAEEDVLRSYDLCANSYVTKWVDLAGRDAIVGAIEDFWLSVARLPLAQC